MRLDRLIENVVEASYDLLIHWWHDVAVHGHLLGDWVHKNSPFILIDDVVLVEIALLERLLDDLPSVIFQSPKDPIKFVQLIILCIPRSQRKVHLIEMTNIS